MIRRWFSMTVSLVAVATLMTGCFLFGPKTEHVSIMGGKAEQIQIRLDGAEQGVCPGEAYQVSIRVTTTKGETLTTWLAPQGDQPPSKAGFADFSEFEYKLLGGAINEKGMFVADIDALPAAGSGYKIAAAVKDNTSVNAKIDYDQKLGCTNNIDFSGSHGTDGYAGGAGAESEAEGSPAGGLGGDGGFGGNGGEAEVTTALVRTLIHNAAVLVKVEPKGGTPRHFLVEPMSKEGFTIDCSGGNGGNGGDGGAGATGGNGGKGGAGGDGGDGGVIRGYFDTNQPMLQQFMKYLHKSGAAGNSGKGGDPGGRDSEGRPMLPGPEGDPGQPGTDGPWPDVRPELGTNLFADLPEGVFVITDPWVPPPASGPDPNKLPVPSTAPGPLTPMAPAPMGATPPPPAPAAPGTVVAQ